MFALGVFLECTGLIFLYLFALSDTLLATKDFFADTQYAGGLSTGKLHFTQMVRAMLDFMWGIRYHTEAIVRRACVFAAFHSFALLPLSVIQDDFSDDYEETQLWMKGKAYRLRINHNCCRCCFRRC